MKFSLRYTHFIIILKFFFLFPRIKNKFFYFYYYYYTLVPIVTMLFYIRVFFSSFFLFFPFFHFRIISFPSVYLVFGLSVHRQSIISFENYKAFFPHLVVYGMSNTNTNNITYPLWIQFFTLKQQQQQQTKTKTLK